jgi:hypothetical protein
MYYTHHFAHPKTLARVKTWLTRLGLDRRQIESHATGTPRIALRVEPPRLDAIRMLINAVERTDPDGFPSFWEIAKQPYHAPDEAELGEASPPRERMTEVIGWHPID